MNLNREELRSAIIGMVLGDGCISKRHLNGEACFQMSHCEEQYEYMLWKQLILNNITSSIINPTEKLLNGKIFKGYHLNTKRHPFFTKLYKRFYHNRTRVVDEYLVKKINQLALSIWFMDDGTSGVNKRRDNENPTYYICSNGFDYANHMLLKKSLKINFDLDFTINKSQKSKDGTYNYRLRLATKCNDEFIKIVKPYIELVPCMLYKIRTLTHRDVLI